MCLPFENSVVAKLVEDGIKEKVSLLSRIMKRGKGKSTSRPGSVISSVGSAREIESIETGGE